jgi:hypothetical protein
MVFGTLWVALGRAGRSPIAPEFDTTSSRLMLAGLILVQGVLRSGTRLLSGWRFANWGKSLQFVGETAAETLAKSWWKLGDEQEYWSDHGVGREALLGAILRAFPGAEDDPTGKSDVIFRRGRFWNWAVVTATEYHENEGRLTRLRVLASPRPVMRMIVLPLLVLIPVAVALGFGFQSELLTLGLIYGIVLVASRTLMWVKRPRFQRIAREVGLKVV